MYYDRVISPKLEATLKDDDKLKWLYEFVKKRDDLDFLIGANKSMEWISVYRGLTRIIRFNKGRQPNNKIRIDGAEAFVTLAASKKSHIFNDNLAIFSNFEEHLKTLLNRISDDKKFDRYYNNKKEGYYQNLLSRKYGINSSRDDVFVIIDKEVVFGHDNDRERQVIFGVMQKNYRDLLKKISSKDPKRFGSNLAKKAIGNELDFLAWKSDGTLLLIELKHGTNTSGIYLSPLQIGLYAELFEHYKKNHEECFYKTLTKMVEQKQRMGLIHEDWIIPEKIKSIKPMLIISENNPKRTGMGKFREILDICRKEENFGETYLNDIEVCSCSVEPKIEMIYQSSVS